MKNGLIGSPFDFNQHEKFDGGTGGNLEDCSQKLRVAWGGGRG